MLTDSPDFGLTKDEAQLLRLLATELSLADIGGLLRLPRDVVQADAQELYRRLGVSGDREPNGS